MAGFAFHHVGVACRELDHDEGLFRALGYKREGPDWDDEIQGVRARFLTGAGPRIELVCNLEGRSVLTSVLKSGTKFYHVAYEVADLDGASATLASLGGKQVAGPMPGIAFGMRVLCFFMMPNLMLVELISRV